MTATYNTIVAALAGQNTAATARNVAAVAEIITHWTRGTNEAHRKLILAVEATLAGEGNCVGVEEYSLAALYSKHRADGADEEDAMEAAYEAWAELDGLDAHEEVALA